MTTLLIRADANTRIGSGHLMRCLALAQCCQTNGGSATFLSHCEGETLRQRVESAGAGFIALAEPHPNSLDLTTTLAVAEQIANSTSAKTKPWIVLDGYHLDSSYQRAVQSAGHKLMIIDDTAHLPYYHGDILLNQNIGSDGLSYHCDDETKLLRGVRYTLLRQEFLAWKGWQREIPKVAKKILVTMGGGDPDNVTGKIITALSQVGIDGLEVRVVVGGNNPHFDELRLLVSALESDGQRVASNPSISFALNTLNMPELMAWADVAISSGGTTCWELAFMGLPAIVLVLADNQENSARGLAEADVMVNLGRSELIQEAQLADALTSLCYDYERRVRQSRGGRQLIDGDGGKRVIAAIIELDQSAAIKDLRWRRAGVQDAHQVWRLANDPTVRENSFNPQAIQLAEHLVWYQQKLESADCCFWVLEFKEEIAAQVRYDRVEGRVAEIDFSVAPGFRSKGLGSQALISTRESACRELDVDVIRGIVMDSNQASARAFLKAGFKEAKKSVIRGQLCSVFEWTCAGNTEPVAVTSR